MSLELVIRPEAEADALEAYRWYNEQLPGLGSGSLPRSIAPPKPSVPIPKRTGSCIASSDASLRAVFRMQSSSPFFTRRAIPSCGGTVATMPANNKLERPVNLRWPIRSPVREVTQADGRVRRWILVPEAESRYLRVVLLADGETVHNAFFDRRFVP